MVDTGVAVRRRRAFIKDKSRLTLPVLYALFKYLILFPEFQLFFSFCGKFTRLLTGSNMFNLHTQKIPNFKYR